MAGDTDDLSRVLMNDVPLQMLPQSPTPSHFSRITESSPDQHQGMSPNAPSNPAEAQQQQHQRSSLSVSGQGTQVGDVVMNTPGAEFLVRQMNEIRSANGDVVRMMRQLEGNHWDLIAMTGMDQVQQNLEGIRHEMERRTNLLGTGLTTTVAGIEQLRDAALQSRQAYGQASEACSTLTSQMNELATAVRHLSQRVDDLEGQVFLQDAVSKQVNEIRDRIAALEFQAVAGGEWPEAERKIFLKEHKLQSDKTSLCIHDLQEQVRQLNEKTQEEKRGSSTQLALVLERVVGVEKICKKLRERDEEIQGHLSHVIPQSIASDAGPQQESQAPASLGEPQTFSIGSGTPLQVNERSGEDDWWEAYDDRPISSWLTKPPGLPMESAWMNEGWGANAPTQPPPLPKEFRSSSQDGFHLDGHELRVAGGQWKLMKEFPRILEPRGQAWERGLQFSQYATEMVSVASCIGAGFGKFVRHQIDAALGRFQRRMDAGVHDPDVPPVASGCEEFESRLAMTLLSQTSDDIKRGVIESAAGQVVPSLTILEAILERYQPGGIEEKSSLTSFLRNLPQANTFTECLATLRRLKLATSRILVLGLPSHPPHEAISSLNHMVKTLEKKSPTLSTRLNLLRLRPEILNPTEEGVSLLQTAIEAEARRLAAEEFSKPHHPKGSDAGTGEYEITAAKGKGKGKKGKPTGDTKSTPCAFFNTERGCLKGKDCEYWHGDPKGAKAKGKGKGKEDSKTRAAAKEAEAKAKEKAEAREAKAKAKAAAKEAAARDKPDPKAKPGAKAKAAALVGAEAKSATCYRVCANMALRENDQPSDDGISSSSELSELDGVRSDDLTPSEFGDEFQEESDDEPGPWMWSLRLTGLEWKMWTHPGNIVTRAHAEFEHIDDYRSVEHGAWILHRAGQLDELPAVLNDEWTVTAVHNVLVLDPVTRVFKGAFAFELERVDVQSKLRFVVAVERNQPYVEPWPEDVWFNECMRFGFGAPTGHVRDRIPLEEMLNGHGFGHLAETLGLLGAEFADDLAFLSPRDLVENGIQRQVAEDLFQHEGVLYEVHASTGVQGVRLEEEQIEELAFSLYASWQAGEPVSDEEYDPEVQQRFHGMVRRRRQGAANMCCVSGNRVESDGFVLVDSGANEVLRPQTKRQSSLGEETLQVTLASGSQCAATLNKHGEVCMISENGAKGEWIVGVRKIIDIGGAFNWDQKGARISYPHPFEHARIVNVDCVVTNGLPYMRWSDFKLARIALSKHYRMQQKSICSHKVVTDIPEIPVIPPESQVIDWVDVLEFQEESGDHIQGCKAVEVITSESFAEKLLERDHVEHHEVLAAVKMADLKPLILRRSSKVVGEPSVAKLWVFGSYVRGGLCGITRVTKQHPFLTKLATKFMKQHTENPFMAIAIAEDVAFKPHRDPNDGSFDSTIVGLSSFQGGHLWTENASSDLDEDQAVWRYTETDSAPIPGKLHRLDDGRAASFCATRWHGTEPYVGNRVVMISYIPKGWKAIDVNMRCRLEQLGFQLPRQDLETRLCAASDADVAAFKALIAQSSEVFLNPGAAVTLEERNTLQHDTYKHSQQKHPSSPLSPDDGDDDEGIEGRDGVLGCEGYVGDGVRSETEHPWKSACDLDLKSPLTPSPEDAVRKACREGLYDKRNHASVQARGHRRPHRKLPAKDINDGVISIDLSGPHKESFAGNRYALVACAHIAEGLDLPFVRGIRTKEAAVVTEALRDILNQLVSMAEGQQITFRIHSDQGREFTARLSAEQLKTYNHYRTFAVPYSHQSNGRVENLIDQLKTSTATMLLGGKLDMRFWDELMVHAAKLRRMRALNLKIPKDLPAPGDYVLSRLPRDQMPDFRDRTEPGVFLGLSEHVANGSKVLVERDGRVLVRYARLPILLDREKPRWRLVENPGSDQKTWVSDKGQIAWAAPSDTDILTVEEKLGCNIASPDEVFVRLNNLLEKTRGSEVEKEIFNLFSHGIIAQLPEVAEAHMVRTHEAGEEVEEEPHPADESEDSFGHKFMKFVASRAVSAPDVSAPDKSEKYITRTDEDEQEAEEIFQNLLREAQQRRGSAEVVPNSVLTGERAEKWIEAVQKELTSVESKDVLLPVRQGYEREDLHLEAGEEIPRTIPMKLVLSEKPLTEPDSSANCDTDGQGFLAKARLVACGNFQNNEFAKDELSTENVPSWIVRPMYHKLAQEPTWIAGAADISTAFLNTVLRRGEAPLLDPPAILKRLKLVPHGVKYLPLRALYGLRISPKEWAKDRDSTLNGSVLEPREGDEMPAVRLEPLDICEGLWRLIDVASGQVTGLLTLYVDDVLVVGCPEMVSRCLEFIGQKWAMKLQGFISREERTIKCGSLGQLERKTELVFLGVQMSFNMEGDVIISQRAWILQELHRRQWLHLKGCATLPQLELNDDEVKDEAYEQNKLECQRELGTLLWMSTRSRPDIASTVGILASELTHRPKRVLQLIRHVWRYIRGTLNVCLTYKAQKNIQEFTCYSDASFAPTAGRSRSGMVYMLGSSILDWASTKQTLTSWSATEAETVAMSECLSQGGRMQDTVNQLIGVTLPIMLRCDNAAAIILALRESLQPLKWKTRGVALRASWLRDSIRDLEAGVTHEPGATLVADLLTKTLPRVRLQTLREKVGLLERT